MNPPVELKEGLRFMHYLEKVVHTLGKEEKGRWEVYRGDRKVSEYDTQDVTIYFQTGQWLPITN